MTLEFRLRGIQHMTEFIQKEHYEILASNDISKLAQRRMNFLTNKTQLELFKNQFVKARNHEPLFEGPLFSTSLSGF